MPRPCSICTHEQRQEIDQALADNETLRAIARQWRVSKDALSRHKEEHLPAHLVKAKEVEEVANANDLLARLAQLVADAQRIGAKAEKARSYNTALTAIREQTRIWELVAKLQGELPPKYQHEWKQIQVLIVQALQPYPAALEAVAHALVEVEPYDQA